MAEHASLEESAEAASAPASVARSPVAGLDTLAGLLALQQSAGNRVVGRLLARLPRTLARQDDEEEVDDKDLPATDVRAGTLIHSIVINLDDGHCAFLTTQGPPITGTVATDLAIGSYTVKPQRNPAGGMVRGASMQWVFDPGQVKSGIRFDVTLNGALPETLAYPESLPVIVTHGFQADTKHSLEETKKKLLDLIDGQDFKGAFELLSSLNSVDLADLLNAVHKEGSAVMVLLTHFQDVAMKENIDVDRLLTALESVEWPPDKLYVDNFSSWGVDKSSFSRDAEREKKGLWNVKIVFVFGKLTPERAIVVYADDIVEAGPKSTGNPHYGPGGFLYPDRLNKASVPRMWEAKKKAIEQIEAGNVEFIWTSFQATQMMFDLVMMGSGLLTMTVPAAGGAATGGGGLRRPVSEAMEAQPGRWLDDFEGGANMSEAASQYQSRVCNADPGKGYYVKGVQFDGYDGGKLVDAKFYPEGGRMARQLQQDNYFVGNKLLDQARRQVTAAGGTKIEWRVASEGAAGKIRQLFQTNDIPIDVVYVP